MPNPSVAVLQQPSSVGDQITWSMDGVRRALNEHESGVFESSAGLATDLGRDDRITPCLEDRVNALVGGGAAEFSLEPSDDNPQASKGFLAELDWYPRVVTDSVLRKLLLDIILLGFSLWRVVWERDSNTWRPKQLVRWYPRNVRWDQQTGKFSAITNTGSVEVDPDDPNWLLVTRSPSEPWMDGTIRQLGFLFVFRSWTYRDWARYNERHGLPIITLRTPNKASYPVKERFFRAIKRLGSSGMAELPMGADEFSSFGMDLLEPKSRSFDSFDKFQDRVNTAIAILLKGQNLTTEVQQGAYASTGWHMRIRKDYAENDADVLSESIRDGLLVPFAKFNRADFDPAWVPWPKWNLEVPEDMGRISESVLNGARAIEILKNSEFPVDWDVLLPKLGIPLKAGKATKD